MHDHYIGMSVDLLAISCILMYQACPTLDEKWSNEHQTYSHPLKKIMYASFMLAASFGQLALECKGKGLEKSK